MRRARCTDHSSFCSNRMAPTRRVIAASLGKMPITSVRRLIGESFPDDPRHRKLGAENVVDITGDPVSVPKIVLGGVAMQVILGAVLISALHAALEDREESLDRFGVDMVADILACGVANGLAASGVGGCARVNLAFVDMEAVLVADIRGDDDVDGRL